MNVKILSQLNKIVNFMDVIMDTFKVTLSLIVEHDDIETPVTIVYNTRRGKTINPPQKTKSLNGLVLITYIICSNIIVSQTDYTISLR